MMKVFMRDRVTDDEKERLFRTVGKSTRASRKAGVNTWIFNLKKATLVDIFQTQLSGKVKDVSGHTITATRVLAYYNSKNNHN